jgi:hypothetical protein
MELNIVTAAPKDRLALGSSHGHRGSGIVRAYLVGTSSAPRRAGIAGQVVMVTASHTISSTSDLVLSVESPRIAGEPGADRESWRHHAFPQSPENRRRLPAILCRAPFGESGEHLHRVNSGSEPAVAAVSCFEPGRVT